MKFNREKVEDDTIRPEISNKMGKLPLYSGSVIYHKDEQLIILKNIINKFGKYLEENNFKRYEKFVASWIIDKIFLQAFVKLHDFLVEYTPEKANEFCMAGFILKNTLSENGAVTR